MTSIESGESAVLVVGAGPSGLALALSLATAGVAVRLIDSQPAPAETSRAIGIQARTLEMLDLFGLGNTLAELGLRARAGNIYEKKRQLVHLDLSRLQSRYPFILLLDQTETERILAQALLHKGVQVERGVELMSFQQDKDGVDVVLARSGSAPMAGRFAYMVGCDGAHSLTRHNLGIGFAGRTLRQKFMLADLDVHWQLPDDEFHVFTSPDGLAAIFPMRRGHRIIAGTPDEANTSDGGPTLPQLQEVAAQRSGLEITLSNLRWSSFFQVNSRLATRLQVGRVFLAGDAAHIHSPAGAQGMNTGIQDALNLAWKLAFVLRGDAGSGLLDTYQAERYRVERGVLRNTGLLTKMVSLRAAPLRFVRNLLVPPLTRTKFLQRAARRTISQVGISYKHGHAPVLNGLTAGDRMPDVGTDLDGVDTQRLYSFLDSARFTLLLVSRNDATKLAESIAALASKRAVGLICARALLDEARQPVSEQFYLIRPDAYIAQLGSISKVTDAIDWLGTNLGNQSTQYRSP